MPVDTIVVEVTRYATPVRLTGEIKAIVESDVSFRFAGRIATRTVDVGDRVDVGQVLATLETDEEQADVMAAEAGVRSAEATLEQARANFDRQTSLLGRGFTTQNDFDDAEAALRTAEAGLEGEIATLATARDRIERATLRAEAPGVITARNAEAGQVVAAAQTVFTIARDGGLDAVFEVYEALLASPPADGAIEIALVSDPTVKTTATVREISPVVDPATGAVRVKLGLTSVPRDMRLGAAVTGIGAFRPREVISLPSSAFFTDDAGPVVWVVDPKTDTVSMKAIVVDSYLTGALLVKSGLEPGEVVVTAGAQLLTPGQRVKRVAAAETSPEVAPK